MRDDRDSPDRLDTTEPRTVNVERTTYVNNRQPEKEEKSPLRWLLPFLLLLLLGLGLLYYFMNRDDDTANTTQTNSGTSENMEESGTASDISGDTITDMNALMNTTDGASLVGKSVSLPSATVVDVIGDKSFTIGSADRRIFALLSDRLNSGQAEQAIQVKPGETRSVQGTIVAVPQDTATLREQFQLTEEQASELQEQGFYISVSQTSAVSADSTTNETPTGAGTE